MRTGCIAILILISVIGATAETNTKDSGKLADKKFWTVTALSIAATAADVEITARALQNPNCREHSPLFGSHPSRAKMYAISVPATTAYSLLGYILKKRSVNFWAVPQLSLTGGHVVGSALSARCF